MRESGASRVSTSGGKSYADRHQSRGLAAELIRDFDRYLNIKYPKQLGKRPLTVYIGPATRDRLLPDVAEGMADIAVGNLTVTDERQKLVDFVALDEGRRTISEVVVTGPKSPEIPTLDDLAGKTVQVRKSSSYYESLQELNARFKKEGKPEMTFVFVPESLEDEDMMEMLNTGLIDVMVVDDWKARMWAQVLPKIKVRTDLVVRADAKTRHASRWRRRKSNRRLLRRERQSTGTVRYLATSAALTAVPRLPHDCRMYVTTSATSWSVSV